MFADVVIYQMQGHSRSMIVCAAMLEGIQRCGAQAVIRNEAMYQGIGDHKVAIFYGLAGNLRRVMQDCITAGLHAVNIDLGYWGREDGGRRQGHHKFAVNNRHPTAYFQNRKHDDRRSRVFNLTVAPWRRAGRHILLAGMGPKAAWVDGLQPEEWERAAIKQIRAVTDRAIMYRPKPSYKNAIPIIGTIFSDPNKDGIDTALRDCHAVVTHHSNAAVDGLLAGVPAFCVEGVAVPMGSSELSMIESPRMPDGRDQWVNDIAYTQWSVPEMKAGLAWRYLKDEGLVP